jgi:hypothetical protein
MTSKKRARKNPKYIDWRTSEAKNTIMRDLADGWLTADGTKLSAEEAWEVYQSADLPAFQGVCFQQFKERLADHRKAFLKQSEDSIREEDAFCHDCLLYPRDETHNRKGMPIFDRSPARDLLRQDIQDGAFPFMTPMQLWNTRPEYMLFPQTIFKHRIYQEIRRTKFLNWLEMKRAEKKAQTNDQPQFERNYRF